MYDNLSIEQPIPDPFDGDVNPDGGGCKAAPALGVVLVAIILVVLFITITKNK